MIIGLFPGQGSQYVGMAKEFLETFPIARETFEEASDAIKLDLKKLCNDGSESDLKQTQNTQPALLVTSIANYRVLETQFGFQPSVVAGHSLGEYSALVASQAFTLETAIKWVRQRGIEMQKAVGIGEGGMAAVMGLKDQQIEALCNEATSVAKKNSDKEIVEPANFNSPGQVVVSGTMGALQALEMVCKNNDDFSKAKVRRLEVSAPFHCRLMKPAAEAMKQVFQSSGVQPKSLRFPYVANLSGEVVKDSAVIFENLIEQIDHPVRWTQSMKTVLKQAPQSAVEIGPGKVLQGLMKRIAKEEKVDLNLCGINSLESLNQWEKNHG